MLENSAWSSANVRFSRSFPFFVAARHGNPTPDFLWRDLEVFWGADPSLVDPLSSSASVQILRAASLAHRKKIKLPPFLLSKKNRVHSSLPLAEARLECLLAKGYRSLGFF